MTLLPRKILVRSITIFLLLAAAGGALFVVAMRQIIRNDKHAALSRVLDAKRRELELPVTDKIKIIVEMAGAVPIRRHFADPSDSLLAAAAFEKFALYGKVLEGSNLFWVTEADKKFHYDGVFTHILNTADSANYWYGMTMEQEKGYNFNINYNPDLNNFNLWINAPVFDSGRRPVGVLGAGIDVSMFIKSIYDDYDESAELYLFNSKTMEITGAADVSIVAAKKKVSEQFGAAGVDIIASAAAISGNEIRTFSSSMGEVGVTAVPAFGWHATAIIPNSIEDYKTPVTWLFLAMLAVIGIVLVTFNAVIAASQSAKRRKRETPCRKTSGRT